MPYSGANLDRAASALGFLRTEIPEAYAESVESAIRFLITHLAATGMLGAGFTDDAVHAVLSRERLGSTAIGKGLAMPHARVLGVREIVGVLASSRLGLPWESIDGKPVHSICLILDRVDHPEMHAQTLERAARLLDLLTGRK